MAKNSRIYVKGVPNGCTKRCLYRTFQSMAQVDWIQYHYGDDKAVLSLFDKRSVDFVLNQTFEVLGRKLDLFLDKQRFQSSGLNDKHAPKVLPTCSPCSVTPLQKFRNGKSVFWDNIPHERAKISTRNFRYKRKRPNHDICQPSTETHKKRKRRKSKRKATGPTCQMDHVCFENYLEETVKQLSNEATGEPSQTPTSVPLTTSKSTGPPVNNEKCVYIRSRANYKLDVPETITLEQLKQQIEARDGIPRHLQHLVCKGKALICNNIASLQDEDNIEVIVKGKGGTRTKSGRPIEEKKEIETIRINVQWKNCKHGKSLKCRFENKALDLNVHVTPWSIGCEEKLTINDLFELTLQKRTDRSESPFVLRIQRRLEIETSEKLQHQLKTEMITLLCFATEKGSTKVKVSKCRMTTLPCLSISADEVTVTHSTKLSGHISLTATQNIRLLSHIECQSMKCQVSNKGGIVEFARECKLQTVNLKSSAFTTYIIGSVSQSLRTNFVKSVDLSALKGDNDIDENSCDKKAEFLHVEIVGNLHIGTDGRVGINSLNESLMCFTLKLDVSGDICNFGQIAAIGTVKLSCKNILSGLVCKDDTVQRYFDIIEKTKVMKSKDIESHFRAATAHDLHQAIVSADVHGVAYLLRNGADPNVPESKTGRAALGLAILQLSQALKGTEKPELADNFRTIISLISSWLKRSGRIVANTIICNITENLQDCSQLVGRNVQLNIKGNALVENFSIWTVGSLSGKCGGNFEVHGTLKAKQFQSLETGSDFLISENGKVLVGEGGRLLIKKIFYNRETFFNVKGNIEIITSIMRQDDNCIVGSSDGLSLKILSDSNEISGKIRGRFILIDVASHVKAGCEIDTFETLKIVICKNKVNSRYGQLSVSNKVNIRGGLLEAFRDGTTKNKKNVADIIFEDDIIAYGINAPSVGIHFKSSCKLDLRPSGKERQGSNVHFIIIGSLITDRGSQMRIHAESNVDNINFNFTCYGLWKHHGLFRVEKASGKKANALLQLNKAANYGQVINFDNMKINVIDQMNNHASLSADKSMNICGRGILTNEKGCFIECKTGLLNVSEISSLINQAGGTLRGRSITICTDEGQSPDSETRFKHFDVRNRGLIICNNELVLKAGNLDNKFGTLQSLYSSIEVHWTSKRNRISKLDGKVLADASFAFQRKYDGTFVFNCVGGQTVSQMKENSDVFSVKEKSQLVIENSHGSVIIKSNIAGDGLLSIAAKHTCTILATVQVLEVEVVQVLHPLKESNPTHKLQSGTTISLAQSEFDNMRPLSAEELVPQNTFSVAEATKQICQEGKRIFFFTVAKPGILSSKNIRCKAESSSANVIFRTRQTGIIRGIEYIKADSHLLIDGNIHINSCCKIIAHYLMFSSKSDCRILSRTSTKGLHILAAKKIILSGKISGPDDAECHVLLQCYKGDILINGSVELSKLTSQITITGPLYIFTPNRILIKNASIHCKEFYCGSPAAKRQIFNLRRIVEPELFQLECPSITQKNCQCENFIIVSGELTVNGTCHCETEKFMIESDGLLQISAAATDDYALIDSKIVKLSGEINCCLLGECVIRSDEEIILENLEGILCTGCCIISAKKRIYVDSATSLDVRCGRLLINDGERNDDGNWDSKITICGKIVGPAFENTDSETPLDTTLQSSCQLDIEACFIEFEGAKILHIKRTEIVGTISISIDSHSQMIGGCFLMNDGERNGDGNLDSKITISGTIVGPTFENTDSETSLDASLRSSCQLHIEACFIDFEGAKILHIKRTGVIGAISISLDSCSQMKGGQFLQVETQTLNIQGEIEGFKSISINAENVLNTGRLHKAEEIKFIAEKVAVNSCVLSGAKSVISAPIYINCPTKHERVLREEDIPILGDGCEVVVEGLLFISIGTLIKSTKIIIHSMLTFDFATKKTTVPTQNDLANWRSLVDTALMKVSDNSVRGSDIENIVKETMNIPKVICKFGTASILCDDIVGICQRIQMGGLCKFSVSELVTCLNKAHTQYDKISRFNLKCHVPKRIRRIKSATKTVARCLMHSILEKIANKSQSNNTNREQNIEEGIDATTYVYMGNETNVETGGNFSMSSLSLNGEKGSWKNKGHIEACGDIFVSAKLIHQKGKAGKIMKALQGSIALQAEGISIEGAKSKRMNVNASQTASVQSADVTDNIEIQAGENAVIKKTVTSNLDVKAASSAFVSDIKTLESANIESSAIEGSVISTGDLTIKGQKDISLKNVAVSNSASITGKGKLKLDDIQSKNVDIKGLDTVSVRNVCIDKNINITASTATLESVKSETLIVETNATLSIGNTEVQDEMVAKSKTKDICLESKINANKAKFEALVGKVSFKGNSTKADHDFGTLSIKGHLADVNEFLERSGAYEDLRISEELNLAVADQNVLLANVNKMNFGLSLKAKTLEVSGSLESKRDINLESNTSLRVCKAANIGARQVNISAQNGLIVNENANINASENIGLLSKLSSLELNASTIKAGENIVLEAKNDVNIKAVKAYNGIATKCNIEAGKDDAGSGVSIMSDKNVNINASDIKSSGKNSICAKEDINITENVYKTEEHLHESKLLGFVTSSNTQIKTHVDGSNIHGNKNIFIAKGNFTSTAASLCSEFGQNIHAYGKVTFCDGKTETIIQEKTNVLGGLLYHEESSQRKESSHGSVLEDKSSSAHSYVTSDKSNIESVGSSIKTRGNFTEIAKHGEIKHKRRILENEETSSSFGLKQLASDKSFPSGLGYEIKHTSNSFQSTCKSSLDVDGNYRVETNSFNVQNAYDMKIGKKMDVNAKDVSFMGVELESSENSIGARLEVDKTTLKFGTDVARNSSSRQQTQHLSVGEETTFQNAKNVVLDGSVVDVGSLQGEIENLTMHSQADTDSKTHVGLGLGWDFLTKTPDLDLTVGVGKCRRVNQQAVLNVRDGSKELSVKTLSLTAAKLNFDGDVSNFAKTIVSKEVHELEANLAVDVNLSKGIRCKKLKRIGLEAGLTKSRLQSCISSKTGNVDASVLKSVNNDPENCRKTDFQANLKIKLTSKPSENMKSIVQTVNCDLTFKSAISLAFSSIKVDVGDKLIDAIYRYVQHNETDALVSLILSDVDNASIKIAVTNILIQSKTNDDFLWNTLGYLAKYLKLPEELVSDVMSIIRSKEKRLNSKNERKALAIMGNFLGIPFNVTEILIKLHMSSTMAQKSLVLIKFLNKKLDFLSANIESDETFVLKQRMELFKEKLGLSDGEAVIFQTLVDKTCTDRNLNILLVAVTSFLLPGLNKEIIQNFIQLVTADNVKERTGLVMLSIANVCGIPVQCSQGFIDILNERDPTKLATWIADDTGFDKRILVPLSKWILIANDPVDFLSKFMQDVGVPKPAVTLIEGLARQYLQKEGNANRTSKKSDHVPLTHKTLLSSVFEVLRNPGETGLVKDLLTNFADHGYIPLYVKKALFDIFNGTESFKTAFQLVLSKFGQICLPVEMLDSLEALVLRGDYTPLVEYICRTICTNVPDSLIRALVEGQPASKILDCCIDYAERYIEIPSIRCLLEKKDKIFKTFKTLNGRQALQSIGKFIGIPSNIVEMIIECITSPRQDIIALKLIQAVAAKLQNCCCDLEQIREKIEKEGFKTIKKMLPLSDDSLEFMHDLILDILELHGRLFDHKPVLQGHISSFVKEFEEKRGNRETDRLDSLHQNISGMKNHLTESSNALDTFLINIQAKLKVAVEVCNKIQEKENNIEVGFLDEERAKRREEWDQFMQQQFDKSAQVDQDLDSEIQKVVTEYQELEGKLEHISTQST